VRQASKIDDVPQGVEICPWGWTNAVRDWASRCGWVYEAPLNDVVATANSRQFSHSLEQEFDLGLAGSMVVSSLDELHLAAYSMPRRCERWVVKANFGMSARERILGKGRVPDTPTVNWVRKRLEVDGAVFFEPWVERIEEVGLQFQVPQVGPPQFQGCTPLLTLPSGQYRGSRFACDVALGESWQEAIDVGMQAAKRVQELGYFGPLGIDAVRYRDDAGKERLRPLQDINARWTMGRFALGLRRLLAPGEVGTWLHVNWSRDPSVSPGEWFKLIERRLPAEVRIVPTTPFQINYHPTRHGSLVAIASTREALEVAEQIVFAS
jgi:hypothetical protein